MRPPAETASSPAACGRPCAALLRSSPWWSGIFWLATLLALAGKLTLSASYQVAHLHCTELYPAEVRTWGLGTSTMLDRIGSVSASFLVDNLRTVWANAPSVVFGCASIFASAITFLLPETKGAALHDTIASLEASGYRRKRLLSCCLYKEGE